MSGFLQIFEQLATARFITRHGECSSGKLEIYLNSPLRVWLQRNPSTPSMWCERVFNISPEGPFKDLAKLLLDQGWGRLLSPLTDINVELVCEFYANALLENPHTGPVTFETFVRGQTIRFECDTFNTYLGNPFELDQPDDLDDFHDKQNSGHFTPPVPHEEIRRFLLLEGFNYNVSEAGREYRAQYKFMTNEAKFIQKFILYP
ncbi:hypothetical protein MTR_0039s0050 [Medicago truncatula]|uniref:Uncharacterized protein n=1 Tax=Medicago truncatula TaxID=3880 RepID=A0A072TI94_MEDTR|nr:hypothetical protein MTR_0039s0050 [Medicago truncatula]